MNKLIRLSVLFFCLIQIPLLAQTISGSISDETNQSMIGAAVRISGTTIGTVSDINGKFQLNNVPVGKAVLEFSFVGYSKVVRTIDVVKDKNVDLKIKMTPNANSLN